MSAGLSRPFDKPLSVSVVEGEIVLLGPDGIAGSFTPEAAEESAQRLLKAVAHARESHDSPTTGAPPAVADD